MLEAAYVEAAQLPAAGALLHSAKASLMQVPRPTLAANGGRLQYPSELRVTQRQVCKVQQ